MKTQETTEVAVFGGGCFWCTEAVFKTLKGVWSVSPGYAGGTTENPTYDEVSSGKTGHAEVTRVEFDPDRLSYRELLTVFFAAHDPTTLNRQGNDIGTQYRSVIFTTNEKQEKEASAFIQNLNNANEGGTVVTEVHPLTAFFPAEDYHKDYYAKNPHAPYCQIIIDPKVEKMAQKFPELVKEH